MGRLLWFALGAAVGGGLVAWYFKNHALELTAGGIAEKLGASPGTISYVKGLASDIQGLN